MRTTSRSRFAVVGMAMAALLLTLGLPFPQSAAAATFNVNVSAGPNAFTPQDLGNITAGDTVTWIWASGTHDTQSANIPAGAVAWVSPFLTSAATTFSQTFTVAGNYRYFCSLHSDGPTANLATQPTTAQVGQFTVVAATTPTPTSTPTPGVSPSAPSSPSPSPSAPPSPSPSAPPSTTQPSAAPSSTTLPPSAAPAPSGNSGGTAPVSSAKPRPPATDALRDLPGGMPGLPVLALALAVIGSAVIALGIESVRAVARRRPGR